MGRGLVGKVCLVGWLVGLGVVLDLVLGWVWWGFGFGLFGFRFWFRFGFGWFGFVHVLVREWLGVPFFPKLLESLRNQRSP